MSYVGHKAPEAEGFAFLQVALIPCLTYRTRTAGLAVWALTVFSLSYAFFACLLGEMAWTNTFL